MNKFFVFLAGVVTSVVVVGGIAFWFLVLQPGGEKAKEPVAPIVAPVTGQQAAPDAGGAGNPAGGATPAGGSIQPPVAGGAEKPADSDTTNNLVNFPVQEGNFTAAPDTITQSGGAKDRLYIEGRITLPPALKKLVEKSPNAVLALRMTANSAGPAEGGNLIETNGFTKVAYPMSYKLEISRRWVEALRNFGSFSVFVRGVVCLDKPENVPCTPSARTNIEGVIRYRAKIPRELKGTAVIPAPTLVLNRLQKDVDAAACKASGGTIGGVLKPTLQFRKTGVKKVAVLALPYHEKKPPLPYSGPIGPGLKATESDIQKMPNFGISYSVVPVGAGESKFSLKVPSGFEGELFRTYYVACADNESDTACVLKGLPTSAINIPGDKRRAAAALVGGGFESAYCGMKDHPFHLHAWERNAMKVTEQSVHLADPPEIIEGAVY